MWGNFDEEYVIEKDLKMKTGYYLITFNCGMLFASSTRSFSKVLLISFKWILKNNPKLKLRQGNGYYDLATNYVIPIYKVASHMLRKVRA